MLAVMQLLKETEAYSVFGFSGEYESMRLRVNSLSPDFSSYTLEIYNATCQDRSHGARRSSPPARSRTAARSPTPMVKFPWWATQNTWPYSRLSASPSPSVSTSPNWPRAPPACP
ncbi:MAG: hypothetical protein R2856_38735 [Caldilineaceae bacterium]